MLSKSRALSGGARDLARGDDDYSSQAPHARSLTRLNCAECGNDIANFPDFLLYRLGVTTATLFTPLHAR